MHRVALVLVLLAALTGCTPRERSPNPASTVEGRVLVAALAFRTGGGLDELGTFGSGPDPAAVPEEAGSEAVRALAIRLIGAGVPVASSERVLAATPPAGAAVYDARLGARVATKVGANFAVIGAITRYLQREGSALGVRTPASVAYQVALVRARDEALVTIERFDYTQQPLTSNLLDLPRSLRAGGRWLTREELLEGALGETAGKFARVLRGDGSK